ncbi:hypothetical protein PHLCEN_2v1744 [Hermanssonia centrifuga]|uniref:Uncharacterized protein n=1 Tax=Hermanssonia centrifuga TaxID=98765 RepID=A0A2R6RW31_9APHY|nr:hypothetical protein PHLCEN_2v1744 [Hermanssonia centrifuga]
MIGAAFTAAANYVPSWNEGLGGTGNVGGLFAAILAPSGGFGKFLLVLIALTTPSLIGYWIAPFTAIIMTEHFVFRRGQWSAYEMQVAWNKPKHRNLSRGYAATFTFFSSLGLIVACMAQEWWTGPVARSGTGDIAMLVSFVYSVAIFSIARRLEKRWTGEAQRPEVREVTGTSM